MCVLMTSRHAAIYAAISVAIPSPWLVIKEVKTTYDS